MTQRLIETWLPIAALGEESVRERRSMTALPPIYYLHVWWARRPLVASRAAVLASLLPADADREMFMHLLGIHGDPVASRRRIDQAKRTGKRFEGEAYSYPRAFSYRPTAGDRQWLIEEAQRAEIESPVILDPTAGGGSIPFEAVRLGIATLVNDLNPVAALVLRATVQFPMEYGQTLVDRFRQLANRFVALREERLKPHYPDEPDADAISTNYLWARTIACPYCEGLIPLSPNWHLAPDGTGVRLRPDPITKRCAFEIVTKARDHSAGTVKGGDALCPYTDCNRIVDGSVIKEQAQAGQMGDQLFAVVFKRRVVRKAKSGRQLQKWVRGYRTPLSIDDNHVEVAARLDQKLSEWEALDNVPSENLPMDTESWTHGNTPAQFGATRFTDLFSPRQLLCHGAGVEVFRELMEQESSEGRLDEVGKAAFAYLALSLDKLRDYNSRMTRWHSKREVMVNTFDRHDFAAKWSYAEMSPIVAGVGYDWALGQTAKSLRELVDLVRPDAHAPGSVPNGKGQIALPSERFSPPPLTVTCTSADDLSGVANASVDAIIMDPPYYANVMYAELSDFFYVWLKRTAGRIFPDLFRTRLTDKTREAVANVARFARQKGAGMLAKRDYRQRMASIFAECSRVLRPAGILTLMFTHKENDAWDALTSGLLEAGFTITASWPINTEAEASLHIREKSAANSTIFLVCRPRPPRASDDIAYWEDVEPIVAQAVRRHVEEYQKAGIAGVDLYLACFGPALKEMAHHWPLRRGQPRRVPEPRGAKQIALLPADIDPYAVTPEDALDSARREVKRWRLERLSRTGRRTDLDALTEWFVLAWDAFRAPEFPYDEALRLARVCGLDIDRDVVGHLAEKKGSDLILWDSATRVAKHALGPADGSRGLVDALHHAAYRIRTNGLEAGRQLLEQTGSLNDPGFAAALSLVLEVLPVGSAFTKSEGETGPVAAAGSDFDALENLRRLALSDRVPEPEQLGLWTAQAAV